jgi:hypothetical protein
MNNQALTAARPQPPPMNILTYSIYEDFHNQVEKSGLTLPLSCLDDEKIVNEVLQELTSSIDPIEAISFSSFLNMVVQTCEPGESARLGRRELAEIGFGKNIGNNKVFFHRDCLLHMMSRIIIDGKNGTMQITGGSDRRGTKKYYKSLLLINSKINRIGANARQTLLKDHFIRDYPLSYAPQATSIIFKNRLQRYWYIYSRILPGMGDSERKLISIGINALEKNSGLTLQDHYLVLSSVLSWFLISPVEKRKGKNEEAAILGFDYRNLGSFYINKNNFPNTDRLIRLIKFLAKDINCLQTHFIEERKDEVIGFFRYFRDFFDRSVFKIDDDRCCILDLKFLMEGLCSGFLWRIKDNASLQNDHQQLKGYYGQLIEKYFVFLIEQIFGRNRIVKVKGNGPDAKIETDDCLIIFEFTTEYYRFASLYNESTSFFSKDLKRLLFNRGKDDPDGRNKKDRGKFLKLNEYLDTVRRGEQGKTIITVLVTENYLGDYDLLNQFDNILDIKIQEYGLTNLRAHKPLILCLDDFEIFWALSTEGKAVQDFEECYRGWENSDKGRLLYNFSNFISSNNDAVIKNDNYLAFFDYSKFLKELGADLRAG